MEQFIAGCIVYMAKDEILMACNVYIHEIFITA